MRHLLALGLFLFSGWCFAATVYITEYQTNVAVTYQAVITPALATQTVAVGVSSTQSAAFNASTSLIRVHTDVACSVQIGGTNPTATSSSMRMAANQTEYFFVKAGDKLAVITNN